MTRAAIVSLVAEGGMTRAAIVTLVEARGETSRQEASKSYVLNAQYIVCMARWCRMFFFCLYFFVQRAVGANSICRSQTFLWYELPRGQHIVCMKYIAGSESIAFIIETCGRHLGILLRLRRCVAAVRKGYKRLLLAEGLEVPIASAAARRFFTV